MSCTFFCQRQAPSNARVRVAEFSAGHYGFYRIEIGSGLKVPSCNRPGGVDFFNRTLIPTRYERYGDDKMNQFLRILFGTGLMLTEPRQRRRIYNRVTDKLDDVADQALRGYDAAADRVERVYRSARGDDTRVLASAGSFLIGMGVGVGAGMLLAPASGKKTRENIAEKLQHFQSDVRESWRHAENARKTA